MDATSSAQSALFLARQPALPLASRVGAGQSGAQKTGGIDAVKAATVSKEYESVFISQFLGSMFSGISTDGLTGGGEGEQMFRSLMIDEYAKGITARGGFGLASHMQSELMKHQQGAAQ